MDQPTAPDQALLAQMAKIYRQCRPDLPPVTASEAATLLPTTIAALRAYRQPQVVNFQGARRTLPDGSPYRAVVL